MKMTTWISLIVSLFVVAVPDLGESIVYTPEMMKGTMFSGGHMAPQKVMTATECVKYCEKLFTCWGADYFPTEKHCVVHEHGTCGPKDRLDHLPGVVHYRVGYCLGDERNALNPTLMYNAPTATPGTSVSTPVHDPRQVKEPYSVGHGCYVSRIYDNQQVIDGVHVATGVSFEACVQKCIDENDPKSVHKRSCTAVDYHKESSGCFFHERESKYLHPPSPNPCCSHVQLICGGPHADYRYPIDNAASTQRAYTVPTTTPAPSLGYHAPSLGYHAPSSGHHAPSSGHQVPSNGHQAPPSGHQALPSKYHASSLGYDASSLGYDASPSGHHAPPSAHHAPSSGHQAPSLGYDASSLGYDVAPSGHHAPPSGHHAPPSGHHALPGGYFTVGPPATLQPYAASQDYYLFLRKQIRTDGCPFRRYENTQRRGGILIPLPVGKGLLLDCLKVCTQTYMENCSGVELYKSHCFLFDEPERDDMFDRAKGHVYFSFNNCTNPRPQQTCAVHEPVEVTEGLRTPAYSISNMSEPCFGHCFTMLTFDNTTELLERGCENDKRKFRSWMQCEVSDDLGTDGSSAYCTCLSDDCNTISILAMYARHAQYPLDYDLQDYSGFDRHGLAKYGVYFRPTQIGVCFNGMAYFKVRSLALVNLGTIQDDGSVIKGFSVIFWMLRTNQTDNTANMSLISNGRAYDQLQTLDISSGPDVNDSDSQTIVVRALLSGQEYVVQATAPIGEWLLVAFVCSAAPRQIDLFVEPRDSVAPATLQPKDTLIIPVPRAVPNVSNSSFKFGRDFVGYLHLVQFFQTSLQPEDIKQLLLDAQAITM